MRTVWIVNQYGSTPDTGLGGRHYYLAKELARLGYKVYLIASSSHHLLREKPDIQGRFKIESTEGFNFVWVNMPSYLGAHSKKRVLNWLFFPLRILKLSKIISGKPDVILVSSPSPLAFLGAQRLAKIFRSRLIFEVRDIWPLTLVEIGGYSPRNPLIRLMQWIEDKAYRDSDAVISNLKNAIDHMVFRGLPKEKFVWIPNGFSKDEILHPEPLSSDVLNLIPKNKFLIGYTGTFGLANDLKNILEAAALLKSFSDIHFVLVGGGKDKESLINLAEELDLGNITFVDYIGKRQIPSVLKFFDVLIVGAKNQPMYRFGVSPNKLFDYMISGKPVLYYIDSGDYHPVRDADCGLEIEPENPEKLSEAVLVTYNMSADQRKKMGSNARKAALGQYEYGQLAKKLSETLFVE